MSMYIGNELEKLDMWCDLGTIPATKHYYTITGIYGNVYSLCIVHVEGCMEGMQQNKIPEEITVFIVSKDVTQHLQQEHWTLSSMHRLLSALAN